VSFTSEDDLLFGFGAEGEWLVHAREAEVGPQLGRLGPYELLGEVGRGGQGVVFRARQPGTGRDVALKRLILGAFASESSRRRFEREVDAVTRLSHPAIVTVYGVEEVDGASMLAMEWIEGEPVTRWADGRDLEEVLALFLQVCDAIQHAHQRGVLHRDLKPSNVIVDRSGRARVLDFGLAKLTSEGGAAVTASGEFVGTPAYAAPEQWRGADLDARADVYSLGAILFELCTGRAVLEGAGFASLLRERSVTPRPSSLVRTLSPELDAIVLQALALEPAERYQSVDALASDVRRYLAGEAVLAHPPGAWYLLKKLVARNRAAALLAGTLLVSTVLYAVLATQQARRLAHERDRAVTAGEAEGRARSAAEAAKDLAEEEKRRAQAASQQADAALRFVAEDVISAADPTVIGHEPTLFEILRAASPSAVARFEGDPAGEAMVREMLADSFYALGHYADSESETRRVLELRRADPSATPALVASAEHRLARALAAQGAYTEAEALDRSAVAQVEFLPEEASRYAGFLDDLAALCLRTGRGSEAIMLFERALATGAGDEGERLATANNLATALFEAGRLEEARALFEKTLAEAKETLGEHHEGIANLLMNLALANESLGDREGCEDAYRRTLAFEIERYGEEHPVPAGTMGRLARFLADEGELGEAEELARHSLAIQQAAAPGSIEEANHACWLALVLGKGSDVAAADSAYREALARLSAVLGPDHPKRLEVLDEFASVLLRAHRLDEAEDLLVEELDARRRVGGATSLELADPLERLAGVLQSRGELDGAAEAYAELSELLAEHPAEHARLVKALEGQAAVLRRLGESERAGELEQRATELR
jgi:non-specific serine/threonine protein kinase/serine/threonine-protein kinase